MKYLFIILCAGATLQAMDPSTSKHKPTSAPPLNQKGCSTKLDNPRKSSSSSLPKLSKFGTLRRRTSTSRRLSSSSSRTSSDSQRNSLKAYSQYQNLKHQNDQHPLLETDTETIAVEKLFSPSHPRAWKHYEQFIQYHPNEGFNTYASIIQNNTALLHALLFSLKKAKYNKTPIYSDNLLPCIEQHQTIWKLINHMEELLTIQHKIEYGNDHEFQQLHRSRSHKALSFTVEYSIPKCLQDLTKTINQSSDPFKLNLDNLYTMYKLVRHQNLLQNTIHKLTNQQNILLKAKRDEQNNKSSLEEIDFQLDNFNLTRTNVPEYNTLVVQRTTLINSIETFTSIDPAMDILNGKLKTLKTKKLKLDNKLTTLEKLCNTDSRTSG